MNIPRTHSKASFEIQRKADSPESAQVKPHQYVAPRDYVGTTNKVEDHFINCIGKGKSWNAYSGRKPGTRIEWDEITQSYIVV